MAQEPAANQPPTNSFPAASRTPDGFDVLILDAGTRQSLAAARSLGRAGLRVLALLESAAASMAEGGAFVPVLDAVPADLVLDGATS